MLEKILLYTLNNVLCKLIVESKVRVVLIALSVVWGL